MKTLYNYLNNIKLYFYNFIWKYNIFTNSELFIINKNETLKLKYNSLDIDEIYNTLNLLNKTFTRYTPPDEILDYINAELRMTNLTFEIKPESINVKNIVANTLLKYLKEKFEIIVHIKKSITY
jgi:hypothetical protein